MKSHYVQERIQAHLEAANLNTDEIIGTMVSQMRGDLADVLPENPILKAAKKRGISTSRRVKTKQRLIKQPNGKLKRVVDTEVELYSAQAAVKTFSVYLECESATASAKGFSRLRVRITTRSTSDQ